MDLVELFRVLPWQKKFLKGFLANQVSALSIRRSNGKSTLLAAVACAAIDGPLAKPEAEMSCSQWSLRSGTDYF